MPGIFLHKSKKHLISGNFSYIIKKRKIHSYNTMEVNMIITDLSGQWEVLLDESKADVLPDKYPDMINLPDSTSNAGLGRLNPEIEYGLSLIHI